MSFAASLTVDTNTEVPGKTTPSPMASSESRSSFLDDLDQALDDISSGSEDEDDADSDSARKNASFSHDDFNKEFHQIVSSEIASLTPGDLNDVRRPRLPRDRGWAAAFFILIPLSLLLPYLCNIFDGPSSPATKWAWGVMPILNVVLTYLVTFKIVSIMYRSDMSSDNSVGDFDSANPMSASMSTGISGFSSGENLGETERDVGNLLTRINVLKPLVLFVSVLFIFTFLSGAWAFAIPLILALLGDVRSRWRGSRGGGEDEKGRKTFFNALTNMALEILQNSLRKPRVMALVVSAQVLLLLPFAMLWSFSFLRAAQVEGGSGFLVMLVCGLGGYWGSRTVMKLLTIVGGGGVYLYFHRAGKIIESVSGGGGGREENGRRGTAHENGNDEGDISGLGDDSIKMHTPAKSPGSSNGYTPTQTMSTYDYNNIMSDPTTPDSDDEKDEHYLSSNIELFAKAANSKLPLEGAANRNGATIIIGAFTTSFGSASKAALLGGLAQWMWSVVRFFETTKNQGYVSMEVEGNRSMTNETGGHLKSLALDFITSHTDFALAHCSAYFKSYSIAASDVTQLIEVASIEALLKQDITSATCISFSVVIGCVQTMVFAAIVVVLKSNADKNDQGEDSNDVGFAICLTVSFLVSFSIHTLTLEIMRGSIKAVYVKFAEKPESLSQAFPLIHQRFSRIREVNE